MTEQVTKSTTKVIGKHKLEVEKYLSKDSDSIVAEVSLGDSFKDALKSVCVPTQYTEETVDNQTIRRFKIKQPVRNSVNWSPFYNYLFTTDAVNNGKVIIKFDTVHAYTQFIASLRNFKDVVQVIESYIRPEKTMITYNLEVA
jgi:hypothetical protein